MCKYYLLILLGLTAGVHGKSFCNNNTVHVEMPDAVKSGSTATLLCKYTIGEEPLHSVRWYKGDEEFFTWSSEGDPKIKTPFVAGVTVDVANSSSTQVVLTKVQAETVGTYTCKVSTIVPNISTVKDSNVLHLMTLPKGEPTVFVDNDYVGFGETVHAVCAAAPSYPPAEITWLVNGEKIRFGASQTRPRERHSYSNPSTSFYNLRIGHDTFKSSNKANLTCVARVADAYAAQKTVILEKNPAPVLYYTHGAVGSANVQTLDVLPVLLLSLFWLIF